MSKGYRPITLLNTLCKALESQKLTYLADTFNQLRDTLMGARRAESTESVIEPLTEQVHAV